MATTEQKQLDELVEILEKNGRDVGTKMIETLRSALAEKPEDPAAVERRRGYDAEIIVSLTRSDLEQRARLCQVWGVPHARMLIAETAAQWATEVLGNGEPKRRK
jgi:hypothetical protein